MADFPRTLPPEEISAPWLPGALKDVGHAGVIQIRATKAVGWTWKETFGLLSIRDATHMELFMFVQKMWNRGEINDFVHPLTPGSGIPPNGLGTSGVLVDGASQTGDTLLTDAWPINTPNAVRAGDVIKVAGDDAVYMVTAAAGSNGVGEVDIPILPPLRFSPANNAALTTTDVKFRMTFVADRSRFEPSRAPLYYAGLSFTVKEAL